MSVLFLPPPSASAVPDASETVSGKIRIATSAEATTGTNDLTAMTPAKVKTVVDAAVVGGVTYQGTFDTSSPVDLSNALKGDMYVISVAGTYQGIVWAVGDHLLINEDMGGTISPSKIDKVDNTDAVTSVAGKTGAVTLVPSDITGLATVASTGAYSDLSGTPTNVSSFTNDAGYLTSAPVDSVAGKTGAVTLELDDLTDVTISGVSAGESIVYNGTLSAFQNATITASVAALNDVGDVDTTGVVNTNVIKYNSTSGDWEAGAVAASEVSGLATVATTGAYSDLSGTPTLATVATTGAYSDLTGTPTLGTAAAEDVGTAASNVVQLDGSARLPAVDGSQLTNLPSGASTLDGLTDVSAASPNNGDVIAYNSTSGDWESVAQTLAAPPVTLSSPSANVTLSAPSSAEEVYIFSPTTTGLNIGLVAAATCGSGFRYYIKNTSSNPLTIDPNLSETIDGDQTYSLSVENSAITIMTDGSNWFII